MFCTAATLPPTDYTIHNKTTIKRRYLGLFVSFTSYPHFTGSDIPILNTNSGYTHQAAKILYNYIMVHSLELFFYSRHRDKSTFKGHKWSTN